jgi:colanic acid biosynthesis glycosyl transferase WcaI
VMPSKLGGMLASGRAVVAMACPGTELYEVVAPRGVVVPPEDVAALVAAIEALAADPARRIALGMAAREFAERTLSSATVLGALSVRLCALAGQDEARVGSGEVLKPKLMKPTMDTATDGLKGGSTGGVAEDASSGAPGAVSAGVADLVAHEPLVTQRLEPTQVD